MGYACNCCGHPVCVGYMHGVLEISVEIRNGKIIEVDKCPGCGTSLIVLRDLEFTPDEEYRITEAV